MDAYLRDGELHIEGQDLGTRVSEIWGDSDYEYFYRLSREGTERLHDLLKTSTGKNDDLLSLIKIAFSGSDGCSRFREFCEKNGLEYRFSSYA